MAQQLTPLPIDKNVRYGVLENGLTYILRHNDESKNRANFYIAQKVGSVLEEDNQRGLAHFLEHMAFNGSEHFPGKSMILLSISSPSGSIMPKAPTFTESLL